MDNYFIYIYEDIYTHKYVHNLNIIITYFKTH